MTRRGYLWAVFSCGLANLSWSMAAEPFWFSVAILVLSICWFWRWWYLFNTLPEAVASEREPMENS